MDLRIKITINNRIEERKYFIEIYKYIYKYIIFRVF